jgi:prefoldin subunit 5
MTVPSSMNSTPPRASSYSAAVAREAHHVGKLLRTSDRTLTPEDLAATYEQLIALKRGWCDRKGQSRARQRGRPSNTSAHTITQRPITVGREGSLVLATLEELEARIAALEADRADYRAVLSVVNTLGATVRELAETVREHSRSIESLEGRVESLDVSFADLKQEMRAGFRSNEEHFAELRDLIIERT